MIAFTPEVIFTNLFYSLSDKKITRIQKKDITDFCDILESIVCQKTDNKHYVYFDFDKRKMESFYKNYFGVFHEIGGEFFLAKELKDIEKTNSFYSTKVRKALSETRKTFSKNKK